MDIRLFAQGATGLDPNLLAEIQEGMHEGGYINFKRRQKPYIQNRYGVERTRYRRKG